jgi:hypothetical protein
MCGSAAAAPAIMDGAAKWSKLDCPTTATGHSCSHRNSNADKDEVIALFFQVELAQGEDLGRVVCSSGEVVHCHRSWVPQEGGSSGSCWWIQPAGTSFTCTGKGTVHFIGSNVATLPLGVLSSPSSSSPIDCLSGGGPLPAGSRCTYTASSSVDEWVSLSFIGGGADSSQAGGTVTSGQADPAERRRVQDSAERRTGGQLNSFRCTHSGGSVQPCSYSLNATVGGGSAKKPQPRGSSCTFLLPASSTLECKVVSGAVSFTSAFSTKFTQAVYGPHATPMADNYTCPDPPSKMYPDRHGQNPCNCAWQNPYPDRDIAIAINARSIDEGYNNFFVSLPFIAIFLFS